MHATRSIPKNNYIHHPKLNALIHNQESMTEFLASLNYQLSIEELGSDISNNEYSRFAVLKLDTQPVIVAISVTHLENKTFYNILSQARNNSIGEKLFATNCGIVRDDCMEIKTIALKNITSKTFVHYLLSIGYKEDDTLIGRSSKFCTTDNQTMHLTEWVLPSIVDFL